jgi:hypothetical protein
VARKFSRVGQGAEDGFEDDLGSVVDGEQDTELDQ